MVDMGTNFACGYSQINNVRYCHPQDPNHDGDCYTLTLHQMSRQQRDHATPWYVEVDEACDEAWSWLNPHTNEPSAAELAEYVLARITDEDFKQRFLATIEGRV